MEDLEVIGIIFGGLYGLTDGGTPIPGGSLFRPDNPMIHQSSLDRAYGVAGLARGSAIQVARAVVIVPDNEGRHVQHRTVCTKSSLSRRISGCTLNCTVFEH